MNKIGWKILQIPNPKSQIPNKSQIAMFIKKTSIVTVAKIRRPQEIINWKGIKEALNHYRVHVCRIDPEEANSAEFAKNGFKPEKNQMVATKTLLLDLTKTEENILKDFTTETRRKLRKLGVMGYGLELNDFDNFYKILKEGYREIDVWCPPKSEYSALVESFVKKCFCVTIGDKAGCLVIIHQQVAEYYYASATKTGKAENLPYLVAWEAMREAKKRGAQLWDWNGLYDERWPEKRYLGFSFFKKRFGGVEYELAGGFLGWRLLGRW